MRRVDHDRSLGQRLHQVETDLAVLKWMLGLVVAGVAALLTKAFL